ncbi:MAG: DHH family phosphoesterase [Gammaproteobacteria bacterium]
MADYDVFNGDADGICALLQLRLAEPREAAGLVTGVKREIDLLRRVLAGAGDRVTVLDVAVEKNRVDLDRILAAGASVFYADHHHPGEEALDHPNLLALINTAPEVCTSLLVNGHLRGAHAAWAVVGAFGDNLAGSARACAATIGLDAAQLDLAERLGTCINYNGYGPAVEDLHFPPDVLYRRLLPFRSPFEFAESDRETFARLEDGYREDMARAAALMPVHGGEHAVVYILPDEPWARRVSGVYSNDLVNLHPARAHAVLTAIDGGDFLVSVRAPLSNRSGADEICRQFPTGGGRKAAAGINRLPASELERLIRVFDGHYAPRG